MPHKETHTRRQRFNVNTLWQDRCVRRIDKSKPKVWMPTPFNRTIQTTARGSKEMEHRQRKQQIHKSKVQAAEMNKPYRWWKCLIDKLLTIVNKRGTLKQIIEENLHTEYSSPDVSGSTSKGRNQTYVCEQLLCRRQ